MISRLENSWCIFYSIASITLLHSIRSSREHDKFAIAFARKSEDGYLIVEMSPCWKRLRRSKYRGRDLIFRDFRFRILRPTVKIEPPTAVITHDAVKTLAQKRKIGRLGSTRMLRVIFTQVATTRKLLRSKGPLSWLERKLNGGK